METKDAIIVGAILIAMALLLGFLIPDVTISAQANETEYLQTNILKVDKTIIVNGSTEGYTGHCPTPLDIVVIDGIIVGCS